MRLLYNNLVDLDTTVLTATSTAAGRPVTKLRDQIRKRVWRATASVQESVTIDLGSAGQSIKAIAVAGHNLSVAGTIEFLHSTDGSTYTSLGTISISPQIPIGYGYGGYGNYGYGGVSVDVPLTGTVEALFIEGITSRYIRVTFRDPSNDRGYVEAGRIFVGTYWEPPNGILFGWGIELIDPTEIVKTIGGQKTNNTRNAYLRANFTLPDLSQSDAYDQLYQIIRTYQATRKDSFLALLLNETDTVQDVVTLYGRFVGDISIANTAPTSYDAGQLTYEESL